MLQRAGGWRASSGAGRWPALIAAACVLLGGAWAPAGAAAAPRWRPETPYASHSMLYLDSPTALKRAMFREAAASGASGIRLDLALSNIFTHDSTPDWHAVDEVTALSRRYRLRVTAVILTTPAFVSSCHHDVIGGLELCAPRAAGDWAALVGQVAAHTWQSIRDFEIVNEPDRRNAFTGSPAEYADMLVAAHDAIKAVNPAARILLGGLSDLHGRGWMSQAFAAHPGLAGAFDVANVHLRAPYRRLVRDLRGWQRFFAKHGAGRKPLWVTEFGYPSSRRYQYDRHYHRGAASQAAYLARALPALVGAGADRVFLTLRDNLSGQFASEGIVSPRGAAAQAAGTIHVHRKPAFYDVAAIFRRALRAAEARRR